MRAIVLASAALVLSMPAHAQTIEERLLKARTEVNATQNAADRALTAIKKTPPDIAKATTEINATKNAASRALYAIDQALKAVQPAPAPTPTPAPEPTPTPTPTPTPIGSLRAVSACTSPFPMDPGNGQIFYPKLNIGDTFDPIAKGWTHDTKHLTTVSAGTFLSTCFG